MPSLIADAWFIIAGHMGTSRDAWALLHVCKASRRGFLMHPLNALVYRQWCSSLIEASRRFTKAALPSLLLRRNRAIDFQHCIYLVPHQQTVRFARAFFAGRLTNFSHPAVNDYLQAVAPEIKRDLDVLIVPSISERNSALLTAFLADHSRYRVCDSFAQLTRTLLCNFNTLLVRPNLTPFFENNNYLCLCSLSPTHFDRYYASYPFFYLTATECSRDIVPQDFQERVNMLTQ